MKAFIRIYSIVFTLFLLAGCKDTNFKKTAGGMPYQLFKGKGGKKIAPGSFIKINATTKIEDSILFTTKDKLPTYILVGTETRPYDLSELWTSLQVGDSVVTTQMIDTFMNRNPGSIPPNFKKGERILTYIKVIDVFDSDSSKTADETMENNKWLEQEISAVSKRLKEKNIQAQKTPSGAFVEIIKPGEGNLIDSGKYVSVKYTGTSFSGVMFDSNIEPGFFTTESLSFTVGSKGPGSMIKGFDECMKFMKKGTVANIYIPSLLAYGPNPGTDKIKPFENIQFIITVLDVQDKAPAQPIQK